MKKLQILLVIVFISTIIGCTATDGDGSQYKCTEQCCRGTKEEVKPNRPIPPTINTYHSKDKDSITAYWDSNRIVISVTKHLNSSTYNVTGHRNKSTPHFFLLLPMFPQEIDLLYPSIVETLKYKIYELESKS